MAKKSRFGANPGTGIASILMIFVVLCIATFGVLSFVSARADLALTETNAQTVQVYYGAEEQAQRIVSRLDALLQQVRALPENASVRELVQSAGLSGAAAEAAAQSMEQTADAAAQYRLLAAHTAASLQENAPLGDGTQAVYVFPLTEVSELRVTVELAPRGERFRCRIVSQRVCEIGAEEEPPLNVWPGI